MNNDRIIGKEVEVMNSGAEESRPEKETNVRLQTGLKAGYDVPSMRISDPNESTYLRVRY